MRFIKQSICTLLLLNSVTSRAAMPFADFVYELDYNVNVDYVNASSQFFLHNQIAQDTYQTTNAQISPQKISEVRGARVDGYHQDKDGFKYFSFDADIQLNSTPVSKNDIVRCNNSDCSSAAYILSSLYLQPYNINAFTFDPDNGDLLFSIDSYSEITPGGLIASPTTVIRKSGSTYTKEFTFVANGSSSHPEDNIVALSYLPNKKLVVSVERQTGYLFYVVNTTNLVLGSTLLPSYKVANPPTFVNDYQEKHIMSLMAYEDDLIFKNGFE